MPKVFVDIPRSEKYWFENRNGMWSPIMIELMITDSIDPQAMLTAYGVRGMLRGGLGIPVHSMDKLAMLWLQMRGYTVVKKVEKDEKD